MVLEDAGDFLGMAAVGLAIGGGDGGDESIDVGHGGLRLLGGHHTTIVGVRFRHPAAMGWPARFASPEAGSQAQEQIREWGPQGPAFALNERVHARFIDLCCVPLP